MELKLPSISVTNSKPIRREAGTDSSEISSVVACICQIFARIRHGHHQDDQGARHLRQPWQPHCGGALILPAEGFCLRVDSVLACG